MNERDLGRRRLPRVDAADIKRKPGRPPLPVGQRRSATLVIDMLPVDYDAMRETASAEGTTLAGWARQTLYSSLSTKRRPGRPLLPAGTARTVKILVALTPDELEQLDAVRGDVERAVWIRQHGVGTKRKRRLG